MDPNININHVVTLNGPIHHLNVQETQRHFQISRYNQFILRLQERMGKSFPFNVYIDRICQYALYAL